MSETDHTMPGAAPSLYPVVRLIASLMLVTVGGAAMYAVIVALKPASIEFDVSRGVASVPYMLFMLTGGVGGVFMGRLADRFGVLLPVLIGCVGLPAGMAGAAFAEEFWQFCAALGVLSGLLGTSALFAPVAADISHWFTRRRGLAVAIVITGTYFAGALWPPIVQASLDARGWRETFLIIAIVMACVMLPLTAALYRKPVVLSAAQAARTATGVGRPLGFAPGTLQSLICVAGLGCCVAMAMPQVHIVAHISDLGYAAQRGAEMLSLMLGTGIVSRIGSGFISDRIGGLRTLLLGSVSCRRWRSSPFSAPTRSPCSTWSRRSSASPRAGSCRPTRSSSGPSSPRTRQAGGWAGRCSSPSPAWRSAAGWRARSTT